MNNLNKGQISGEEQKEYHIEVEKCDSESSLSSSQSHSMQHSSQKGSFTMLPLFGMNGQRSQAIRPLPQFLFNHLKNGNQKDVAKYIKRMSSSGIFSYKSSEKIKPKMKFSHNSVFQRGMSARMLLEVPEEDQMISKKKITKHGSIILMPLKNLS